MSLGQDVLSDLGVMLSREWVLGNGLGGSASGTVAGAQARTSHAHLVAADLHGRTTALLLKLEERLSVESGTLELASLLQSGSFARAAGHRMLEEFKLDPWPVWRFRAGTLALEKSLFLIYGHNAVVVTYRHLDGPEVRLTISPLLVARDPDSTMPEGVEPRGLVQGVPGRCRIETLPGRPPLTLWYNGTFMPARARQRQVYGVTEAGSEPPFREDALVPGYVEGALPPGGALHVVASAEEHLLRALAHEDRLGSPPPRSLAGCVEALAAAERERFESWRRAAQAGATTTLRHAREARRRTVAGEDGGGPATERGENGADVPARSASRADASDPLLASLAESLRLGLVRRGPRLTLLGSLPGGAERVSECLRALPALISLRGFAAAREILRGLVEYLDEGFAPESFDREDGRPRYGDPEPSLRLVIAGELYARRSQDREFVEACLYPALEGTTRFFRSGTRHGVHVDAEGLLVAGEGEAAVRRADLNALWYHATVAVGQLARSIGRKETGAFHLAWAHEHQRRFNEAFWDDGHNRLIPALEPGAAVAESGPGQLWAGCLPPALLPAERAERVLETVERELFTPLGLRERPGDGIVSTAWLGPYYSAYLRAHRRGAEAQARVRGWIGVLRDRLSEATCGSLPSAFALRDGADTSRSAGEPLSVVAAAELLRFWLEDLDHPGSA